ncbi:MAG: HpcH/HpaI aldolase/citrate lyase family protein, partial [Nocardioidaceae bacterium]
MAAGLAVTLLYVPADRPERVAKALGLDTDVVIVDLEDAVAPAAKEDARAGVPALLGARADARVQVRVNAADTPWGAEDLAMVADLDDDIEVRLPKVDSPATIDAAIGLLGPSRALHCLIETAVGIEHAYDIARHSDSVASVGLGEADLRSELGVGDERGLDWSRGRIVVAARAAGLPPPAHSVFTNVADLDGLAASTHAGRALGFVGRQAIHPAQLPVI